MSKQVVAELIALIELGMIAPEDIVKCLRKANSEPEQALAAPEEKYVYGTPLLDAMTKDCVQERNFCERCGKRLGGEGNIHTCTPPAEPVYVKTFHGGKPWPLHPEPPPECQTEAEKTAFAFGWWKALEVNRYKDRVK
jgi:hypothetical protein